MMYHGTLTHLYGLDIAVQALGLAQGEMPGAQFWILGDGPEKPDLEELAAKVGLANRVRFVGKVRPEAVPQWLKVCDLGVLATRRDVFLDFSFSNKLSEYIILGKPVICSRLKAIRHYFSEDALAYFEPGDAKALANQMVRLYQDSQLRVSLANKALIEYKPIRWEVMKARYLQLIASLTVCESNHESKQQPEAFAKVR